MRAVIFGGDGFIGRHLAASSTVLTDVVLVDNKGPTPPDVVFADVREPVPVGVAGARVPDWIVALAAVHREPGHAAEEYFETNIVGARNIVAYAEAVGCDRVFFISSMSVYGTTTLPADEHTVPCPVSPYGASKLAAELIFEAWYKAGERRRLIVCRPGVVYGPGDPGNVLRMIRAIRQGVFLFPGDRHVRKSYAYIDGLVESFDYTLARTEPYILYNHMEPETEPLENVVRIVQDEFVCRRRVPSLPRPLLVAAAHASQALTRGRSPLHPVRVRKAARTTHVVPRWLIEHDFQFRFDFRTALRHWRKVAPEDFVTNGAVRQ